MFYMVGEGYRMISFASLEETGLWRRKPLIGSGASRLLYGALAAALAHLRALLFCQGA